MQIDCYADKVQLNIPFEVGAKIHILDFIKLAQTLDCEFNIENKPMLILGKTNDEYILNLFHAKIGNFNPKVKSVNVVQYENLLCITFVANSCREPFSLYDKFSKTSPDKIAIDFWENF